MKSVIQSAQELVKLRAPSIVTILGRHQYRYEAEKVQNLIAAVEAMPPDMIERIERLIEAAEVVVRRDAEYAREGWVKDGAGWDADMISLSAAIRETKGEPVES